MKRLDDWLYYHLAGPDWLGDHHAGGANPPGNMLRAVLTPEKKWQDEWWAEITNDGFQVMIHSPTSSEPVILMRSGQARQMAWFILWDYWAKGTWCGLRRKLWYDALNRRITRVQSQVHALKHKQEGSIE